MKRFVCMAAGILVFAGCIPANTYIRLESTAGPPVQVIDRTYRSSVFSLQAPPGWTLTTSHIRQPFGVELTSPDQPPAVFRFSHQPAGHPLPSGLNIYHADVESRVWVFELETGMRIMAVAQVPVGTWLQYQPLFESVRLSLMATNSEAP